MGKSPPGSISNDALEKPVRLCGLLEGRGEKLEK